MSQIYKSSTGGGGSTTDFATDSGSAIPAGNLININGENGITVTANPNGSNNILINGAGIYPPNANRAAVFMNGGVSNVTGDGTTYTILWDTVSGVTNGITYNSGTGIFTIPNQGTYLMMSNVTTTGLVSANTSGFVAVNHGLGTDSSVQIINPFAAMATANGLSNAFTFTTNWLRGFTTGGFEIAFQVTINGNTGKNISLAGNWGCWAEIIQISQ